MSIGYNRFKENFWNMLFNYLILIRGWYNDFIFGRTKWSIKSLENALNSFYILNGFFLEEEEEEKLDAYLRIPILQDFNYQERRMRRKKEKRNI